jgi:hypothetical protein
MQYSYPFLVGEVVWVELRKVGWHMTMNADWRELHRAAMLELRPEELPRRIDDAKKAIHRRMAELRQDDSQSWEESQALDDALRGLRALAVIECKSAPSALPVVGQGEATS